MTLSSPTPQADAAPANLLAATWRRLHRFVTSPRAEHLLLGLLLLSLHLGLWLDFASPASRALLVAHLGLFLAWQPVWSRNKPLQLRAMVAFTLAIVTLAAALDWLPMSIWVLLLVGLIGGRAAVRRDDRVAFWLALGILLCELLVLCLPSAANVAAPTGMARSTLLYGGATVCALVCVLPVSETPRQLGQRPVDFMYVLTASLLTAVLAMGSLLMHFLSADDYALSVIKTMLGVGGFLLLLAWLWSPLAGFSGFGQVWARYVQNIGTPFERWVSGLAETADRESGPRAFLEAAMRQVSDLEWVSGVYWRMGENDGVIGRPTRHTQEHRAERLQMMLYSRQPMGASLRLHSRLLLSLVDHFYSAKLREQDLAAAAHMRAVHETGARMTHDIKNLLQSLQGMTAAIEHDAGKADASMRRTGELHQLLRRQMPHVTARLQGALTKLQAPQTVRFEGVRLKAWWEVFLGRAALHGATTSATLQADPVIPGDLFDSVADNLLENAAAKRSLDPQVALECTLHADAAGIKFEVRDTGRPVDADVAPHLFEAPIASRTGLGVGLFQVGRHAERLGYAVQLTNNERGNVCFSLERCGASTTLDETVYGDTVRVVDLDGVRTR